jgi:hypothetical protein
VGIYCRQFLSQKARIYPLLILTFSNSKNSNILEIEPLNLEKMTSLPELQIFSLENNVKLAYRSLPTKPNPELPTIVFFHPLLTDSSFFHRQFIDPKLGGEAGRKWNLIAIDLHGHGDTTGRDTFTFSDTSRDSLALLVRAPLVFFSIEINHSIGSLQNLRSHCIWRFPRRAGLPKSCHSSP